MTPDDDCEISEYMFGLLTDVRTEEDLVGVINHGCELDRSYTNPFEPDVSLDVLAVASYLSDSIVSYVLELGAQRTLAFLPQVDFCDYETACRRYGSHRPTVNRKPMRQSNACRRI